MMVERTVYDSWLQTRLTDKSSSNIVLAVVDEKSLDEQGRWGWPREKLARLVATLDKAGAAVIAFDMFFPEPDTGDNDAKFAEELRKSQSPVVLGYFFHFDPKEVAHLPEDNWREREKAIIGSKYMLSGPSLGCLSEAFFRQSILPEPNVPVISGAECPVGHVNFDQDDDGLIRCIPGVIEYNGSLYPPLSVVIAAAHLGLRTIVLEFDDSGALGIRVGDLFVPTDCFGRITVGYRHLPAGFASFSVTDILSGRTDTAVFKGKIVIIGATAPGISDTYATPIHKNTNAAFIHASALDDILAGEFIRRPSWTVGLTMIVIIAMGILSGFALSFLRPVSATAVIIAFMVSYTMLAQWLFFQDGILISPVYPVLTSCLILSVVTILERMLKETTHNKIPQVTSQ